MVLFGPALALMNTGITALISNAAGDREQGAVLGTSSSLDSLSGILAPPVSTGLLAAYGPASLGSSRSRWPRSGSGWASRGARSERDDARVDETERALASEAETATIAEG